MSPQVIESEIDTQSLLKMLDYLCRDHRTIRTIRAFVTAVVDMDTGAVEESCRLDAGDLGNVAEGYIAQKIMPPALACPDDMFRCDECRGVPEFCKKDAEAST
jgi:hypothetical protein